MGLLLAAGAAMKGAESRSSAATSAAAAEAARPSAAGWLVLLPLGFRLLLPAVSHLLLWLLRGLGVSHGPAHVQQIRCSWLKVAGTSQTLPAAAGSWQLLSAQRPSVLAPSPLCPTADTGPTSTLGAAACLASATAPPPLSPVLAAVWGKSERERSRAES